MNIDQFLFKNNIIVYQHQCLGDFLYLQKCFQMICKSCDYMVLPIKKEYFEFYNTIEYPKNLILYDVEKEFPFYNDFMKLSAYMSNHPKTISVAKLAEGSFDYNLIYIPLGISWIRNILDSMREKYKICNFSDYKWQDYVKINFDINKSTKLYYEVLRLKENENYCLINKNFGNQSEDIKTIEGNIIAKIIDSKNYQYPIPENTKMKNVFMEKIDGYSLFDWYYVICKAKKIITVETSLCYLMEILHKNLESEENILYTRWIPESFGFGLVKNIFTNLKWTYKKHNER